MKTSQAGINLIKSFEGLVLHAYRDVVNVLTIGYGHTGDVKEGSTITQAQAEDLLRKDLARFEEGVAELVKVPLNENQFSALVSFSFNLGLGNLKTSTLLKKLNAKDYIGASNEFPKWKYAGGKVLTGLVRRREAEKQLFLKPVPKPATPKEHIVSYTIKKGDNLTQIAHKYKTSIERIMKLNTSIKNPNIIIAGKTIKVPDNR